MYKLLSQLITQSKKASPQKLARLVDQASVAPFAGDLLEVDEPLWGGFWQGDVIAPGYRLPAVELALLRAMRLDATWPEGTSASQFLADLHQAISDPQAGVWALEVAGEPCVVFARVSSQKSEVSNQKSVVTRSGQRSGSGGRRSTVGGRPLATVAWYCATTEQLHAGYRATINSLSFAGAVEQRRLTFKGEPHRESAIRPTWLEQVVEQAKAIGGPPSVGGGHHLAARLDAEILRLRL